MYCMYYGCRKVYIFYMLLTEIHYILWYLNLLYVRTCNFSSIVSSSQYSILYKVLYSRQRLFNRSEIRKLALKDFLKGRKLAYSYMYNILYKVQYSTYLFISLFRSYTLHSNMQLKTFNCAWM